MISSCDSSVFVSLIGCGGFVTPWVLRLHKEGALSLMHCLSVKWREKGDVTERPKEVKDQFCYWDHAARCH